VLAATPEVIGVGREGGAEGSAAPSAVAVEPAADLAVPYGLTERARAHVRGARLVANPGCYATAILMALAPLVEQGLVAEGATVSVAAASGVSGAGNSPKRELLFAELAEDFRAYATGNVHRHLVEMRATLDGWGADVDLVFTPHLLPVVRGILATITVPLARPLGDALAPWREAFADEPFVEVATEPPTLREVQRRNVVRIHATMAAGLRRPTLLVHSAIDNLVKGAAGQALQNANLMLGLDETLGLPG
jgi:N-acetyl-gamma-glutamyl-phosphate reductase